MDTASTTESPTTAERVTVSRLVFVPPSQLWAVGQTRGGSLPDWDGRSVDHVRSTVFHVKHVLGRHRAPATQDEDDPMIEAVDQKTERPPGDPGTEHGFGPAPAPGTARYPQATGYDLLAAEPTTPLAIETDEHLRALQRSREVKHLPRPDQTRVMVVANQKGGVGKTTSTVNVAAALAQHGLRVLVIDLDPQGNASTALRIDHTEGTPGTYDALVDGQPMRSLVQPCPDVDNLLVVPATIDLAGAEIELVSLVARESRLRRAITEYLEQEADEAGRMDYILIDCPPSLGLLTVNALVAGREMLIPIQCEYYALEGLGQLLRNVELIQSHLNPELVISTIMLTMHDARTRLSAGVADEVRAHFGDKVLNTAVPRSVRISEAPSYQQTVMTYDPTSPGALSYLEAARELATRLATTDDSTAVASAPDAAGGSHAMPAAGPGAGVEPNPTRGDD
jgi:chromosome partitioning protein